MLTILQTEMIVMNRNIGTPNRSKNSGRKLRRSDETMLNFITVTISKHRSPVNAENVRVAGRVALQSISLRVH